MKVAIPMVSSAPTRVALRPILSPKWPKNNGTEGRATKATPKAAKEDSSSVVASCGEEQHRGKTATAAVA